MTRHERFLAEMDAVIPWKRLIRLIEPHYPKAGRARHPLGLEKMLRICFVQQWFDLSDPAAEDAIYNSEAIRRFVGVELGADLIPDESSILRFRRLLEAHDLTRAIFVEVRSLLEEKRLLLKQGTIVDATIISAPSSTKNETQSRDPEMRQTKKGNTWHFGMKVHIGTDKRGIVHTLTTTHAAEADINQLPNLVVHGEERELYGDRAYWNQSDRRSFEEVGVRYRVNRCGSGRKPLSERWRRINRSRHRARARGEHPFHVAKTAVGFQQGVLSRADEAHGSCLHGVRAREFLSRPSEPSASWSGVRLVDRNRVRSSAFARLRREKRGGKRPKIA